MDSDIPGCSGSIITINNMFIQADLLRKYGMRFAFLCFKRFKM